jgi:hypothetical protein
MPQVRFEPTIPVFQRAKTVHALDRTASVIDTLIFVYISFSAYIGLVFYNASCSLGTTTSIWSQWNAELNSASIMAQSDRSQDQLKRPSYFDRFTHRYVTPVIESLQCQQQGRWNILVWTRETVMFLVLWKYRDGVESTERYRVSCLRTYIVVLVFREHKSHFSDKVVWILTFPPDQCLFIFLGSVSGNLKGNTRNICKELSIHEDYSLLRCDAV